MTQPKILPTVGRVVWFYDQKRRPGFHHNTDGAPYAAIIAAVCSDNIVNLTVSDAAGTPAGRVGVPLSHDGGRPAGADYWCEWMPYQKGQAAKTGAAEQALAVAVRGMSPPMVLPVVDPGDAAIERKIQAKGKTAPRVTPADIEAEITHEFYFTPPRALEADDAREIFHLDNGMGPGESPLPQALNLLTFCVLVLRNGFTVIGKSACASPENFDAEIGRDIARENALREIWPLLGFRLRDQLHAKKGAPATCES